MAVVTSDSDSRAVGQGIRIALGIIATLIVFFLGVGIAYLIYSSLPTWPNSGGTPLNRWMQIGMVILMAGLFPLSALAFGWLEVPRIIEQVQRDCLLLGTDLPRDVSGSPVTGRWSMTSYALHYVPAVIATLLGIGLLFRDADDRLNINTLQAMRFGFLGAYVYCLNLIYRRYTTLDLQPHVYLYCAAGLIAGIVFNFVAFQAITNIAAFDRPADRVASAGQNARSVSPPVTINPDTQTTGATDRAAATAAPSPSLQSTSSQQDQARHVAAEEPFTGIAAALAAILSFSLGYFPNLAIRWFRRLSYAAIHEGVRRSEALPLSLIDGISDLHETRLRDEGIDNIQNLATANIRDLVVKTPFSAQQIVEWIDQAVLYLYLDPTEIASFRRAGARCVTDFGDLWSGFCVRYVVQPDGTFRRLPISQTSGSQSDFDARRKALAQHLQTTEDRLDALYTATEQGPNMHFVRTYWTNVTDMAALARQTLVKQVCGRVGCALRNSEREGATLTPTDILKQVVSTLLVQAEAEATDPSLLDMTAGSLFGQAWLNRLLGNIPEARRLYEQCIKDFPNDPTAFNDYAWLILSTSRDPSLYEQAARHAQSAVELARKSNAKHALAGYLDTLALAKVRLKHPEEAVQLLDEAMKLWDDSEHGNQPKFLETFLAAAEEFQSQQKYADALMTLDRILNAGYAAPEVDQKAKKLIPNVTHSLITSAQTLGTGGANENAIRLIQVVINSNNSQAEHKDRAKQLLNQWNGAGTQ